MKTLLRCLPRSRATVLGACCLFGALLTIGSARADVLQANTATDNGGSAGWGIFFNLQATGSSAVTVTDFQTASNVGPGVAFSVQIFIRLGSGLGGPLASGPGSSSAGWTSLGTVPATQGAAGNGVSLTIDIPDFTIGLGETVGLAVLFTGAGPRYLGQGTAPLSTFSDANLTLTTGDVRSVPFTTTGSFFSSRALAGSIGYSTVPEPSTYVLLALGSAGALAGYRRAKR